MLNVRRYNTSIGQRAASPEKWKDVYPSESQPSMRAATNEFDELDGKLICPVVVFYQTRASLSTNNWDHENLYPQRLDAVKFIMDAEIFFIDAVKLVLM